MTIQESINRGYNLLCTSIVALSGFAFVPEAILEQDLPDKVDDSLLFLLGLAAIYWYTRGMNRLMRSVTPFVFVVLALIIKFGGVLVEFSDKESVGDDFGGLILFVGATILVYYQYKKTQKLLSEQPTEVQ